MKISPPNPTNQWIYGIHAIEAAATAQTFLERVLIAENATGTELAKLRARLREAGYAIQTVPLARLDKIAPQRAHQGIAALRALISYQTLEEIIAVAAVQGLPPLFILADGITDVRNLGAIARTAEAMGVNALILPEKGSAAITADCIKVAAGAFEYLSVCRVSGVKSAVAILTAHDIAVICLTEKAVTPFSALSLNIPLCLVIGDEHRGISAAVRECCQSEGYLPLYGQTPSLNVSVAVGMALYEINRQRGYQY
jgi:23S rRNA (guanosine2251-2'-O)-methyltransferase